MNSSKTNVNRKLSQKENILPEKAKVLREINKLTGKQLKDYVPREPEKRSLSEVTRGLCKAFRSVASQTILGTPNDYEGVVRYPSSHRTEVRPKREVGLQVEAPALSPRDYSFRRTSSLVDYVKMNQIPAVRPKIVPTMRRVDPCRAPLTYQKGIIPRYLQKLKEQEDSEREELRKHKSLHTSTKTKDKNLEEREEKLRKLASWHDSYKRMVSELNIISAS